MIDPKVFKQVRKRLGLSQAELADALGLSRVTVNKMERGRLARGIPDEIAERLMVLKPRAGQRRAHLDEAHEFATGHPVDDADLWDNEEDES
jgi:transcriptional regulator with XRE-family HTH domain